MNNVLLGNVKSVLCLGAHADDIEIGCGGAILRLQEQMPDLHVYWVTLCAEGDRETEAQNSAVRFLAGAGSQTVEVHRFHDGYFPYYGGKVKDYFEHLKTKISPDLIFTHYRDDLHQDHRLTNELTWNTFRDHLILEYEIPKWDGDLGTPNCYIDLDGTVYRKKIEYILENFPSQAGKSWFKEETFLALMRIRGVECRAPSGYAEGFYGRKITI